MAKKFESFTYVQKTNIFVHPIFDVYYKNSISLLSNLGKHTLERETIISFHRYFHESFSCILHFKAMNFCLYKKVRVQLTKIYSNERGRNTVFEIYKMACFF